MLRWLGILLFSSVVLSQSAEDIAQGYIEAFNAKDSAAILSLFDNPSAEQHTQFLLPYAFERLRIDPQSLRVADQGNHSALVYFNYLPRRGHAIPGSLLLLNTGNGYYLSYSDLPSALRQFSPWLAFRLDLQQKPELLIVVGVIGLIAALSLFAILRAMKASVRLPMFSYENAKGFKPSSENFGLALGSFYRTFWGLGMPLDKMATPHQGLIEMFPRDWGIYNRDDLLFNMMSLYHHGHRANFKGLSASYPEANQDHLAWDMTQYIFLAVMGASVGYLLPHEASNLILHASHRLQKHYASWQDYAKAFQSERFLWQRLTLQPLDYDLEQRNRSQDVTLKQLLKHRDSPWRKIDWETPLDKPRENDFFATVTKHYFSHSEEHLESKDQSILN